MTLREKTLDKAKQYVTADRNLDYDLPERNFETIAKLWDAYTGVLGFKPHDVAVMLALVKVARIRTSPAKHDHWIDIAGYAACGAECIVQEEEPQE